MISHSDEIALTDTRIEEVLKQIDLGESTSSWELAQKTGAQLKSAIQDKDPERLQRALAEHFAVLERGSSDWMIWTEVGKLLEQRRKLVDSESKRLLQQQETLTSSEAYLLFNALTSVILEHVTDREQRAKIQNGFERIVNGNRRLLSE